MTKDQIRYSKAMIAATKSLHRCQELEAENKKLRRPLMMLAAGCEGLKIMLNTCKEARVALEENK
jgi:hypothetical protein